MVIRTKKITKKNKFFSDVESTTHNAEDWVSQHIRTIVLILVVSLIVLVGAYFFGNYTKGKKEDSFLHFNKALFAYRYLTGKSTKKEIQNVKTLFEFVVDNYSGEKGALYALLYLGHLEYRVGTYNQAILLYKGLMERKDIEPILHELSQKGLAYSFLAKKEYGQSLDLLKKMVTSTKLSLERDLYLKMAEAYTGLKDTASLKATLENIIQKFPDDPENDDIKNRISQL